MDDSKEKSVNTNSTTDTASPPAPTGTDQSPPPSSPPPSSRSPPQSSSPPPPLSSNTPGKSPPPLPSPTPLSSPPPSSLESLTPSSSPPPPSPSPSPSPSPPPPTSLNSPPPTPLLPSSNLPSSPPPSLPPPPISNSSPPPSQNNQFQPPTDSNDNNSLPQNNNGSSSNNTNNNGNADSNNDGNNKRWQPPPAPSSTSITSSSGDAAGEALAPATTETAMVPTGSSSNYNGSTVSIPLVAAIVAGAGLLIIIMLLLFFACRRKRNMSPVSQMHYSNHHNHANTAAGREHYNDISSPPKPRANWQATEDHYTAGNNMHNNDQLGELPTTPPSCGAREGGWSGTPPQVVAVTNRDTSSSAYGTAVPPPPPIIAIGLNQSTFTYEELAVATGGFSQANLLGQGGFGYVHKGTLPNGKEIAVKSLKSGGGQGEREFKAEVEIISRVHHRHLVSLVGYCIAGGRRMMVYEFLPNNTLEFHLRGKGQPDMDWPTRLKIALGSAKGLSYLHEDCHPRIIHRDIKSSNILLDFSFEAKVADFGLAKLTSDNNTHVSTRVMGTFGYLAPEYASTGRLTEKSDVFSFGVVLLELITRRRPVDPNRAMEDSLVDWARPLCLRALENGDYKELADPYLEMNYPVEEMARMVTCASACIRHSSRRRPKMCQIVRALEGDASLEDLNDGIKPKWGSTFGVDGSPGIGGNTSGSPDHHSSYAEGLMKLRKMAVEGAYVSSEYGATSEYGLNPSSSSSDFEGSGQGESPDQVVRPRF